MIYAEVCQDYSITLNCGRRYFTELPNEFQEVSAPENLVRFELPGLFQKFLEKNEHAVRTPGAALVSFDEYRKDATNST